MLTFVEAFRRVDVILGIELRQQSERVRVGQLFREAFYSNAMFCMGMPGKSGDPVRKIR